jgi:hypothetical protein
MAFTLLVGHNIIVLRNAGNGCYGLLLKFSIDVCALILSASVITSEFYPRNSVRFLYYKQYFIHNLVVVFMCLYLFA